MRTVTFEVVENKKITLKDEIKIPETIVILVVKFYKKDGTSYVKTIQAESKNVWIDDHDNDYHVVLAVFEYVIDTEINGAFFIEDREGQRVD